MAQEAARLGMVSQPGTVGGGKGGLLRVGPGVEIQPQVEGQGLGEARHSRLGGPGEAEQQFGQLCRHRQGAEGVQAEPDLGFLEFAEVAVRRLQPGFQILLGHGGQLQLLQQGAQPLPQQGGAGAAQLPRLPVFIEQGLQALQVAVQTGPAQGRGQVVEDHRLGTALGLAALPRVIDDEGVEVGQGPQGPFGEAVLGQPQPLARQPFEIAVLANMHHHLGAEALAQPEVLGQVGVGWGQIGAVVAEARITVVAALGLDQQQHLAETQSPHGEGQAPLRNGRRLQARVSVGRTPDSLQPLAALQR